MDFQTWKAALINEIETAAEGRAQRAFADPADPLIEKGQKALYDLAEQVRALAPEHAALKALFNEETELSTLMRARVGEPEGRYYGAKEDLLAAYGIDRGHGHGHGHGNAHGRGHAGLHRGFRVLDAEVLDGEKQ